MSIVTYSKKRRTKVSDNFTSIEFDCKCKGYCANTIIDTDLVDILQKIRDGFNLPVTINSGYRCTTHNKNVGGASSSYHMKGQAADIRVSSIDPREVAKYAEQLGVKGIGLYETFVHIDTRSTKYYWIDGKGQVDTFMTKIDVVDTGKALAEAIKKILSDFGY